VDFTKITEFQKSQKTELLKCGISAGSETRNMSQKSISVVFDRRIQPENAVVALQRDFERFAGSLRRFDPALQDDLIQEMSLGVLQCTQSHTLAFFRSRALSRARDFLRMWRRKSCADWNEITNWPASQPAAQEKCRDWYTEKVAALMSDHPALQDAGLKEAQA